MKKRLLISLGIFIALVVILGIWHANQAAAPTKAPATQSSTKSKASPPSNTAPAFNKSEFSTTDPASLWVVVNKQHPLQPKDYAPSDLVGVGNGQTMRAEAASALNTMLADAKAAGYTVTPASGYRSYSYQITVYNNEVATYGQATADTESARPGYSEHQTGWAMDLASGGCSITDCFGDTPGGQWVTANAYKYGFLLRYPADKTDITGYRAESWHFRYIGIKLATELHNQHIETLEEFFNITGGSTYN